MKVLLLHPEDTPHAGPWRDSRWDRVFDLGLAGTESYAHWNRILQCPIENLSSLRRGKRDFRRMWDLQAAGCGRLVDDYGLDWWEILSILLIEQLESVMLLERLAEILSTDEVFISRPGVQATVLQQLLHGRLQVFPPKHNHPLSNLARYFSVARKLSLRQIADVCCDKYDPAQQLRARFSRAPKASDHPVVLLPTAYVNVSRTGIAYANMLPNQSFLLVSTRRSGWIEKLPPNVSPAWLSSYVVADDLSAEIADLEIRWRGLWSDLLELPEFNILNAIGSFYGFAQRLREGLSVRDAWRNVLDIEPVQAVLCADDTNPHTRIPLLLARERGLPNIACHHGALDGYRAFKRRQADLILAKGKMEQDYLVQSCGVPANQVEIGAPSLSEAYEASKLKSGGTNTRTQWSRHDLRPQILFISEPYELGNARAEEFYRDILPSLAEIALLTGRRLIVKLHPYESKSERAAIVARVLSPAQMEVTQVVAGPLTETLLDATWFAVTVLSTVTTECAVRAIPCFVCKWLEYSFYGYIDQFIRFGVAIGLNDPSEIKNVPQYLDNYAADPGAPANCLQPISTDRLRSLLALASKACTAAAS